MAINRNKILDKAQKYVQQGKLAKAVDEYLLLVDDDPDDVRTLLKIGDLYARIGNVEAALKTYQQVSDHYSKDGFFLKAVAIYKQMLKLDPSAIPLYTKLAELYHQLALNNEALKQYQVVAKHYETKGMKKESLDIYRKMAQLDPDNIASRIKLAELYAREGQTKEALDDFMKLAEELRNKGNNDDLLKVYEKVTKLDPSNSNLMRELAALYLETAEPKRALAKLQICFKQDAKNERTLTLLAKAFVDLQQPEKARAVYTELLALYEEKGQRDKAQTIRSKLEQEGELGDNISLVSLKKNQPAAAPTPVSPATSSAQTSGQNSAAAVIATAPKVKSIDGFKAPTKADSASEKILTDIDVYLRYGLAEKAQNTLRQALEKNPDMPRLRQKLVETYLNSQDSHSAVAVLLQLAQLAGERQNQSLQMTIFSEVLSIDPENAQALTALQGGASPPPIADDVVAESVMEEADSVLGGTEVIQKEAVPAASAAVPADVAPVEAVYEIPEVDDAVVVDDEPVVELSTPEGGISIDSAEMTIEPPPAQVAVKPAAAGPATAVPAAAVPVVDLGDIEFEMERVPDAQQEAAAERSQIHFKTPSTPLPVDDSLEFASPDAVIETAEPELAPPDMLSIEPEVADISMEVEAAPEASASPGIELEFEVPAAAIEVAPMETSAKPEPEIVFDLGEPAAAPEVAPVQTASKSKAKKNHSTELEEASFFINEGFHEEARAILQEILLSDPTHAEALALLQRLEGTAKVPSQAPTPAKAKVAPYQASTEELDFAAEMERSKATPAATHEEGGENFFDLSLELQDEISKINQSDQAPAKDEPPTFDEVFAAFKKGVKNTLSDDETEAHYNLGIAYKEMGLLEDAIREFKLAIKDVRLSIDACGLIGMCYRDLGRFADAEASFRKAIESLAPADERLMGMQYELAEVYISANKPKEALTTFKEVYQINQAFRDVSHRMKALAEQLEGGVDSDDDNADDANKNAGKKSKISYL